MLPETENVDVAEAAHERPLRLIYLFVIITCVALGVSLYRVSAAADRPVSGLLFVSLIFFGVELAAIPISILLRRNDEKFPYYAGEWLWVTQGIESMIWAVAMAAMRVVGLTWTPGAYLFGILLLTIVWILPAIKVSGSKLWRAFFWSAVLGSAWYGLAYCFNNVFVIPRLNTDFDARMATFFVIRLAGSALAVAAGLSSCAPRWLWTIWLGIILNLAGTIWWAFDLVLGGA